MDARQTARFQPEPNPFFAPSDGESEPKSRALWHIMHPRCTNDPITWDHLLDKPPSRRVHFPLGHTRTGRFVDSSIRTPAMAFINLRRDHGHSTSIAFHASMEEPSPYHRLLTLPIAPTLRHLFTREHKLSQLPCVDA